MITLMIIVIIDHITYPIKHTSKNMQIYEYFNSISSKYSCVQLTLVNTFDIVSHDLFLAKLQTLLILLIIISQSTHKISDRFCSWHDISYGVPQGLIRVILFNISVNDMFIFSNGNYAFWI